LREELTSRLILALTAAAGQCRPVLFLYSAIRVGPDATRRRRTASAVGATTHPLKFAARARQDLRPSHPSAVLAPKGVHRLAASTAVKTAAPKNVPPSRSAALAVS
jgi:hypothetical protein